MPSSIQFNQTFIQKLLERTYYEMWLLKEVYNITGEPLFSDQLDTLVYSPNENKPTFYAYTSGKISFFGDWKRQFLNAGTPLVFATTFKLLDMFIDTVLEVNGFPQNFRFSEKIKKLKNGVVFPDFIETRLWLKERIIGIYETLEPLRGTIIHDKQFSTIDGNLTVSSSKKGVIGQAYNISKESLRKLANVIVSIIQYADGSSIIDQYKEKNMQYDFDTIANLHSQPMIGQLPFDYLKVRIYKKECETLEIDLKVIYDDLAKFRPEQEISFDLRVIVVSSEKQTIFGYLIPWDVISTKGEHIIYTKLQLSQFTSEIPDDIKKIDLFKILC